MDFDYTGRTLFGVKRPEFSEEHAVILGLFCRKPEHCGECIHQDYRTCGCRCKVKMRMKREAESWIFT